jgi:dsDNA-specific endonuclease/ATPase MutS2
MSKKIDFNFLHNFLQFIQAKNKWKISEILDNLDISFKELIYILDIVSQIYVDFDDVFVDYEINEDTEEINFLFNDSVYELLSINDSELFNLY